MYTFSQMNRILHFYAVYLCAYETNTILIKLGVFFCFTYNNYVQLYYSIEINTQLSYLM